MQEQENKKDTPMVDIDTSGPSAEVELNDDAQTEEQVETKEQDTSPAPQATSDEKVDASSEEQDTDDQKESKDKELENYSKDVQRRIAKLTGKWREAQRQRDEAIEFAKVQKEQRESLLKKYSSVEQAGVKDREERIKSSLLAAQTKLATARANDDVAAEVEAQKEIARLGYEESRLAEAKELAESTKQT